MTTRVAVMCAALVAAAVAVTRADRFESVPVRKSFSEFPWQMGRWTGRPQPPLGEAELKILGLTDYTVREYSADGRAVGLYVGYWQSQRQGETIHSPQNCLPGAGWVPVTQEISELPDPRAPGATMPVNHYVIQKGLERQVVLYWYQSHGRVVASEYWSKFYLIADAVRLNRSDGAIVRIIAPVGRDGDAALKSADDLVRAFAADLMPQLSAFLPN